MSIVERLMSVFSTAVYVIQFLRSASFAIIFMGTYSLSQPNKFLEVSCHYFYFFILRRNVFISAIHRNLLGVISYAVTINDILVCARSTSSTILLRSYHIIFTIHFVLNKKNFTQREKHRKHNKPRPSLSDTVSNGQYNIPSN